MKILVLYTGGTIGMKETSHGLAPGADMEGWLNRLCENRGIQPPLFKELEPLIDSANATPLQWQRIIDALRDEYHTADAFIVLHGTDTMGFTSAAVSHALSDFDKPIMFTGSQLPFECEWSDAERNVVNALETAKEAHATRARGVVLCFGGKRLQGRNCTKASSVDFDAFAGDSWSNDEQEASTLKSTSRPLPYRAFDIAVVEMVPGLTAHRLAHMVASSPDAVIIRAYGMGNVPSTESRLFDPLRDLAKTGVPIVVCSQCATGGVSIGHYATSSVLSEIGALGAGAMTFESCYARVEFLLAQGLSGDDFASALHEY